MMSIPMKQIVLGLFVAASVSISAYASEWVELAGFSGIEVSGISIDVSSIASKSGYKKVWFKMKYVTDQEGNALTEGQRYNNEKDLEYFNCATREIATIQRLYYHDQKYLGKYNVTLTPKLFIEVAPDTIGEVQLGIVCSKNPRKLLSLQSRNSAPHASPPPDDLPSPVVTDSIDFDSIEADLRKKSESASGVSAQPSAPTGTVNSNGNRK